MTVVLRITICISKKNRFKYLIFGIFGIHKKGVADKWKS